MAPNAADSSRARILLSYRRDDTGGYAPGLYSLLADHFGKESVAWDIDDAGKRLRRSRRHVSKQLDSFDVVVLLIGSGWITATDSQGRRRVDDPEDHHRHELEVALARKIPVIPVLVDGAKMPSPVELPPTIARLAESHANELTHDRYLTGVQELLRNIERALRHEARRPTDEARVRTERDAREHSLVRVAHERAELGEVETALETAALIEDVGRREEALSSIAEKVQREHTETEQSLLHLPLPELLTSAGLKYAQVGDTLALPYWPERADQLIVTAKILAEEDVAFFAVDLPSPPRLATQSVLRNLLRVCFEADYVKAIRTGKGQLRFASEVPRQVLTARVARGLIGGLAKLGDVTSGNLKDEERWSEQVEESNLGQGVHINVDVDKAKEAIPGLLAAEGLESDEIETGVFVTRLEAGDTGEHFPVALRPRPSAISLIAYTPLKPKGDKTTFMRKLLELNGIANVAKVGLDSSGDVALLYEVPTLYPGLMEEVHLQFGLLLLGVLGLEVEH